MHMMLTVCGLDKKATKPSYEHVRTHGRQLLAKIKTIFSGTWPVWLILPSVTLQLDYSINNTMFDLTEQTKWYAWM
eukprot:m.163289 g.163289  ORF g.163289 m.163289 type:complete len:76 (+) comp16389_c0_seq11:1669-1896(+)